MININHLQFYILCNRIHFDRHIVFLNIFNVSIFHNTIFTKQNLQFN